MEYDSLESEPIIINVLIVLVWFDFIVFFSSLRFLIS